MALKKGGPSRWFLLLHYTSFEETPNKMLIPDILFNVGLPDCGRVLLNEMSSDSELYVKLKDTVMEAFHDNGWDIDIGRDYIIYLLEYDNPDMLTEFEDMLSGLNTVNDREVPVLSLEAYGDLARMLPKMEAIRFEYSKMELNKIPKGTLLKVVGVDIGDKVEEYQQSVGKVGRVIEWDEGAGGVINIIELLDGTQTLHLVQGEWQRYSGTVDDYFRERSNRIEPSARQWIIDGAGLDHIAEDAWAEHGTDEMDPELRAAWEEYKKVTKKLVKVLCEGNIEARRLFWDQWFA